jgi:hypothetical protein
MVFQVSRDYYDVCSVSNYTVDVLVLSKLRVLVMIPDGLTLDDTYVTSVPRVLGGHISEFPQRVRRKT